jgi:hypothetical protein
MEKYVKPNMEVLEIPNFAMITADTCPTKMPELENVGPSIE